MVRNVTLDACYPILSLCARACACLCVLGNPVKSEANTWHQFMLYCEHNIARFTRHEKESRILKVGCQPDVTAEDFLSSSTSVCLPLHVLTREQCVLYSFKGCTPVHHTEHSYRLHTDLEQYSGRVFFKTVTTSYFSSSLRWMKRNMKSWIVMSW